MKQDLRNWKFNDLANVRDLGGYETADGQITRYNRFLRSSATGLLSEAESEEIYASGIRLVIDLRHPSESIHISSPLQGFRDVEHRQINIIGKEMVKDGSDNRSLLELYKNWLDNSSTEIAEVFHLFASEISGGVLFHCTAGKDRTGVIAALLLDLVNCDDQTIISDYAESYENIRNCRIFSSIPGSYMHYLYSDPAFMAQLLHYLRDNYQNSYNYLRKSGISDAEVVTIRRRLLEE